MIPELYQKMKEEGRYRDAHLVIRNLFSRNSDNLELFQGFINDCLENTQVYGGTLEERKGYLAEAFTAISVFSETAEITEEVLREIGDFMKKCDEAREFLNKEEDKYYLQQLEEISQKNDGLLKDLEDKILDQMPKAKTQEAFDRLMAEIAKLDMQLDKDALSDKQQERYGILTNSNSQIVSEKMEELNHSSLLEYNKKAVRSFYKVFQDFTENEARYTDKEGNLRGLMTAYFFTYDTSKLFNESLIYYNHVYSMIFQKVSDPLKYKLTEWAIETPKPEK